MTRVFALQIINHQSVLFGIEHGDWQTERKNNLRGVNHEAKAHRNTIVTCTCRAFRFYSPRG